MLPGFVQFVRLGPEEQIVPRRAECSLCASLGWKVAFALGGQLGTGWAVCPTLYPQHPRTAYVRLRPRRGLCPRLTTCEAFGPTLPS